MKKFTFAITVVLVFGLTNSFAQFRNQQTPSQNTGFSTIQSNSLFGWIDPNKFSMHHNFSINYATSGAQNLSISQYTNSMQYIFSDLISARADVSMMYSPYATGFRGQQSVSGIYLNRAQLDFRPWDNVLFQIQYRQLPLGSYYYNPFLLSGSYYSHPFGDE
ncbi:MAG: hypothetical protein FJ218_00540 [Ignavibacteria bacterium]|nr:hypothetical protein [Ignavibacteria bacterium]